MHELSIAQGIIDIVLAEMSKHNLTRVERISLKIGELRQVLPVALSFGFECLSKDTPLEGADLVIESIPLKGRCTQCGHETLLKNWFESCSRCQANQMTIIAGKELEIADFEGS